MLGIRIRVENIAPGDFSARSMHVFTVEVEVEVLNPLAGEFIFLGQFAKVRDRFARQREKSGSVDPVDL